MQTPAARRASRGHKPRRVRHAIDKPRPPKFDTWTLRSTGRRIVSEPTDRNLDGAKPPHNSCVPARVSPAGPEPPPARRQEPLVIELGRCSRVLAASMILKLAVQVCPVKRQVSVKKREAVVESCRNMPCSSPGRLWNVYV